MCRARVAAVNAGLFFTTDAAKREAQPRLRKVIFGLGRNVRNALLDFKIGVELTPTNAAFVATLFHTSRLHLAGVFVSKRKTVSSGLA